MHYAYEGMDYWTKFFKKGLMPTGKIHGFGQAISLNVINFIGLGLGLLQQLAVVRCHGTSAITDFYFLIIVIPQVVFNLSNSIVKNALLPFLVHRRERLGINSEGPLVRFVEIRLQRIGIFLALLVLGIGILQGIYSAAWNISRVDVLIMITCAPFLVLFGIINSWYATTLQSRKHFWPAIAGLCFSPFCGLILGMMLAPFGVWPFVAGQSLGMIWQGIWLKRRVDASLLVQHENNIELSSEEHREVRFKVLMLFLIGVGFQFIPLIERTVAQKAGIGAVTAVALASRIGSSISLIVIGISTVLFPVFAELVAAGKTKEAVIKLLKILSNIQWGLAGIVLVGPFAFEKLLPLILPKHDVINSILYVFPDYLMAGCINASSLLIISCYYSAFKDFRLQLCLVYLGLCVYGLLLSAPLWTPLEFGIRVISLANVIYWLLSTPALVFCLAFSKGRIFPWHYLFSLLGLIGVWIITRTFF